MKDYPEVVVSEKAVRSMKKGYQWVFKDEIKSIKAPISPGDIIYIVSPQGKRIATGYINPTSTIAIRILSIGEDVIDKKFIKMRIERAWKERISLGFKPDESFRIVFSEGDFLPGLIIDKYNNVLSIQILTAGMERMKSEIVEILKDLFNPVGIFERSDVQVRMKEGLPLRKGLLSGSIESKIECKWDGFTFIVDLEGGHKTGFYLDQRDNRKMISRYVEGKEVLDCFSYTGSFAIYAAASGARRCIAVEDSGKALGILTENIRINGFERIIEVQKGDVFEDLRARLRRGERFDCIILDPPPFVREKSSKSRGLRGYRDINMIAMKLLRNGGYLMTGTCSNSVSIEDFLGVMGSASADAGCIMQLLNISIQSSDHPYIISMPETLYLKFFTFKKVGLLT